MRLSHKDFDALQRAILELYDPTNLGSFQGALFRISSRMIPFDHAGMATFSLRAQPKLLNYAEPSPRATKQFIADAERRILVHPFTKYFARTGDVSALKLSDFMTLRQVKNSWLWEEMNKPLDANYHLCVSTTMDPQSSSALGLSRKFKDFAERDRLILNLLRPHILQASRIAELITKNPNLASLGAPNEFHEQFNLSPRECEVADWVAKGKTNPEIALILGTSPRTIEKHMERILEKLRVENRTAAATLLMDREFLRSGLSRKMNPG
jgi:DNA-binding CsgD family transcriptional regulator